MARKILLIRPWLILGLLVPFGAMAQCPEVFDFYGSTTDSPYWYDCSGNNYTFNLQSPDNWGEYTIDWGDGSAVTTGSSWNSPSAITHVYTATVDTFLVTITEVNTGCVVEGVMVLEEASSASIQIPIGGLTQACAPQLMEFINSSTNVSETTIFTWDFGDGSPQETYDYTNWGQTVSHVYQPGTVDCETEVSLTAENYCNTIQGGESEATFNPIRIWDIDEAAITASATVLCYPDTIVEFTNTTQRNCLFQGNIFQRYEYWNFGDYWGEGQDSIIDWTPWPPTFPHEIAYPGIGTYEVMMLDSNYCGIDTAYITIEIVPPPSAGLSATGDTICVGEPITFFQESSSSANSYQWNFGDGIGWLPTGGGNITYVYNNPGTYNVCTAVSISSSSSGCADTACVPVTVLPSPIAFFTPDNVSGCDSLTVVFTDGSSGATGWEWTFDVPPFSYTGFDPPPISYNSTGNYVATLTVESINGCLDTYQEVISVFEAPVPDFLANNVCEGEQAVFTDISTSDAGDPIIGWNWDFGDTGTSVDENPTHIYPSTGSYDVTLTVSTASCSSTAVFPIAVEPAPTADIALDNDMGCSPLLVNFENNSIGADNYVWNFGDGNASAAEEPSNTFLNLGSTDTTYTIVMTASTAFGCSSVDSLQVTVMPGAQASYTDNSMPPSCAPFDAQFINTSVGATSYLWDFGDGTPTSTETDPAHFYENTTGFLEVYDVTLIAYAANGCNDTVMNGVTVYPTADFSFDVWPDSGCAPLFVQMPFISGVNSYFWDFGDNQTSTFPNPTHMFENTTTDPIVFDITFIGISPFGCVDTAMSEVLVNPQPLAQMTADINSGCSPITVEFENLSIQADSYLWNYGDGETETTSSTFHSHTFVNLTNDVIVYEVELTAISDDGCDDTFIIPIQVFPQVIAEIEDPGDGCAPYVVEFGNNSLNADSYDWDLGNGLQSINTNPTATYVNLGSTDTTYTVCMIAESPYGCSDETCIDIVVHPAPIAEFDMSDDAACHPAPIQFINNSQWADSYTWNYGDGNSSDTSALVHTHVFENTGINDNSYLIELIATTQYGCADTTSATFTIYPQVIAAFSLDSMGCSPLQAFFVNQSVGATAGFEWDFGDGQTSFQTNPSHIYVNNSGADTTYYCTLIASNVQGCNDTTQIGIDVYPTPVAQIAIDTTLGCYPLQVVFENQTIGADSYQWVYGTGEVSTVEDQFHTYTYYNFTDQPVTYNVFLNAYTDEGCTSTDQISIDVLPELEADFDAPDEGCSPFEVSFDNNSVGAMSYQWDFGDGNTHNIANPTHIFYNDGTTDTTYTVMLVALSAYGCYDTAFYDITVFATPFANFTATPESQQFPASTIDITDLSVAGDVNYDWTLGDGSTSGDPELTTHTYTSWGVYTITLEITNGACSSEAQRSVEILPPDPIAEMDIPEQTGCAPLTVHFTSNSQYGAAFEWDFGDGGSSSVENPVYTYYQPGTYDVSLTVTGFDGVTTDVIVIQDAIEVYPVAIAAFTVTPNEVSIPSQPVYCINLSQNATSYLWDFHDGTTSTEFNPIHYYQEEGLYDISLIAYNEYGCTDTFLVAEAVHAKALGSIEFPNAFTPNTGNSSGGVYDPWAFNNDIFFPVYYGVVEYQLQIFNKWGELLFESSDPKVGWDGYYRGQLCREDVYAWKAWVRFVDGEEIKQAGDVTLLIK
ncbi:MAG: PKD domain-containing protein [Flavobacteriales bacterium]|nr:PKD domain-containing protein [Flavobacteriales bacterium]